MAKEPVMGRVKTRLAREIGNVGATYFYRHAARAVMLRLARDTRWRTVISLAPDRAIDTPCWPLSISRVRQGGGGLGARMQHILDSAGPGPVLILGTDIPSVKPVHLAAAFRQLGSNDAVLGPAGDGGYWLVGLKRVPRVLKIFSGVRWSAPQTLSDTRANLAGFRHASATILSDVDDARDLRQVRAWSGRVVLPVKCL